MCVYIYILIIISLSLYIYIYIYTMYKFMYKCMNIYNYIFQDSIFPILIYVYMYRVVANRLSPTGFHSQVVANKLTLTATTASDAPLMDLREALGPWMWLMAI